MIYKNIFLSLIPVAIFANEPIFFNKIIYTPLPEPLQLPFIIFGFYFFCKGLTVKNPLWYFLLTVIMLGFVISTRFFITGAVMTFTMIAYFILTKKFNKHFLTFILLLPLTIVVLLAAYTRTFMYGYNLIKVLGIQKYILAYHKSKFIFPFSFWDLLLFNRWHTWWGRSAILSDDQWIIFWPLSVMTTIFYYFYGIWKKISFTETEKVLFIWLFFYTGVLSTGYTATRYFMPVLPYLYILSISCIIYSIRKYRLLHEK